MPEIHLILGASGADGRSDSIAISRGSVGVAAIPPEARQQFKAFRTQIIAMMNGKPRFSAEALRQIGQDMRTILFTSDIGATWVEAANSAGLTTGILATSNELKAIPWEFAAWPNNTDGPQRDSSVVRLVPRVGNNLPQPVAIAEGLRVLMLLASPRGLDPIPWEDLRISGRLP